MAVYGQYETVTELGRSASTSVSRARPADGGWDLGFDDLGTDANFALKAFHVRNAEDAGGIESKRFLERVRCQKKMVDSGAKHWAPIIESGNAGADAYYVTPYYPRTAHRLAHSPTGIDAATLYAVIHGTLQGLLELRRTGSRPHGNIKSTNLLIKGPVRSPVTSDDILLTDPALEDDATIAGEAEDLYNLGEVIYELVLGERFAGQQTWPIFQSPHWARLGKQGDRWLGLCNHLLSPRAAENWLRVDDILDELEALRPRTKRFRSRKLLTAAAVLAVMCGLGVLEYFRYAGEWRELCAAYGQWVGPLDRQLTAAAPADLKRDPYLQEHLVLALGEAHTKGIELDPRAIAGSSDPLPALADHPPLSLGAIWRTERAWRIVHNVDQSLSARQWKGLADLERRRGDYEKRGWTKLAQYASTALAPVERKEADRLAGITGVLEANARLSALDAARAAANARSGRLMARAEGAATIRDKIDEFQTLLRAAAVSDLVLASPVAVERLTQQLIELEASAARFDEAIPLLAEASKRQRAYEVRGWVGPARFLAGLVDRARPGEDLTKLREELAAAKRDWEQVEGLWSQIEQRRRVLETSGDRILSTYREFVAQVRLGDEKDLSALSRRLAAINDDPSWAAAARKVSEPEWSKIDVVAFAQKSEAHHGFAGKTVATTQDLRKWLSEAEGYGTQLAAATFKPEEIVRTAPATTLPADVARAAPPATAPVDQSAIARATAKQVATTTYASLPPRPATAESTTTQPTAVVRATAKPTTAPTIVLAPTTAPSPTTVAVAPPKPDPEKLRREREIAAFVSECREVSLKASNAEIKEAWREKNAEWAQRVETDAKVYTPALKGEREKLRGRLLQLDSAVASAGASLAIKPEGPIWMPPLAKALQGTAPSTSEQLKEPLRLALAGDSKFDESLSALVDHDEQWRAASARLVTDARRVEQLLVQGYGPGDKAADGGASVASALTAVRNSELYKNDAVQIALEPLLRPVAVVENESAPAAMRLLAESGDQPLGVRLAAWSKASAKEVSGQTLEQDLKLAGSLLTAAQQKISERARVEAIKARLEGDLRTRWQSLLESASRDADVETAIALRDRISGVNVDQLSARAKFNFALHDLRTAVSASKGDEADKQVVALAQKMKTAAAGLESKEAGDAKVAAIVAEIDRVTGASTAADLTKLGPGSDAAMRASNGAIRWSPSVDGGGEQVTYRALLSTDPSGRLKEDVTLVFRRVRPSNSSRASWMSTTEVSLGLFCDLMTASTKWQELRAGKMLFEYDPNRGDPRLGPRVWEWPRYGRSPDITWSRVWLGDEFIPRGVQHYPKEIADWYNRTQIGNERGERAPELNPSRRQPMQYVSPKAAMLAASLAGCRLPTAGEWTAAYKSVEQHVGVNLRDRSWRLELEHLNRLGLNKRCRPDAGMFVPAGENPSDKVWERADGSELNDGILWFREVPMNASVFVDLVGNVAEMVSDDGGAKVGVIGGSALSPPDRDVRMAYPIVVEQAASGFSDVGFRLAFSEPGVGVEKLKDAVAGGWYLVK